MQKQQWQKLRCVHRSARYCEFVAHQIRYSLSKVQKLAINLTVASSNLFISYRGSLVSWFCLPHKVYSQQEIIKSRLSSYCREKNQDLYVLVAVRWDILYLISVGAVIAFSSFMNRSCDSMPLFHTPNQFVTANLTVTEIRYFLPWPISFQYWLLLSHAAQAILNVYQSVLHIAFFLASRCWKLLWYSFPLNPLAAAGMFHSQLPVQHWQMPSFSSWPFLAASRSSWEALQLSVSSLGKVTVPRAKHSWAVLALNPLRIIQDSGSMSPQQRRFSWWKLAMRFLPSDLSQNSCYSDFGQMKVASILFSCAKIIHTVSNRQGRCPSVLILFRGEMQRKVT